MNKHDRRDLIAGWLEAVTTEDMIDTMASVGEMRVRHKLADGTRVYLKVVAPNLEPLRPRVVGGKKAGTT